MSQTGAAMAKATILLADNDPEWLRQQKEAFVSEGFNVLTAEGPSEAEMVLNSGHVDAVVLDIRLENDDDDKDVSGLSLMETAPEVGKVITTTFPIDMRTGKTFKSSIKTHSPFVRYVDKSDGIPAIVAAAKRVVGFSFFSRHGWDEFMAARHALARERQFTPAVLALLVLVLGTGVTAVYTANMRWLIGTILLAVLSLLFISKSI
jgi:CheY-like chemotaxis protein